MRFDGIAALAGAQLVVRRGERHGLVGTNGSGKSTLLAVTCGQVGVDRGRVLLGDRDVSRLKPFERARARIGRVFQESRLWPTLSSWEHLCVVESVKKASNASLNDLRTAAGVEREGLGRFPAQLTLLERRRLELVLAMYGADIVLCDEIAAGLGTAESESLYAVIDAAMSAGWIGAVVLVEHKLDLLLDHVQRVSVMKEGRVVATSSESPEAMESAVAEHLFPRQQEAR